MGLKEQRAAALKAAGAIIEKAKSEDRDLTADEVADVEAKHAEVKSLDEKIAAATKSADIVARIGALGAAEKAGGQDDDPVVKSLGESFAKSVTPEQLSRLKSVSGASVAAEFKAATDPHLTPASLGPVLTQFDKTIVRGYRRATVTDLLGVGTLGAGTNAVTYFVESPVEGNFDTVAEGGQKPQLHVTDPTARMDAVKKIAGWWDTSDEMIEDLAFWVSEINNRGLFLLSMVEEAQLVNGNGTGNNIQGLMNRSGIQTETQAASNDSAQNAIFRALMKVQTATGLTADGIIINPADYQALRLSQDNNGQYFGGGFFSGEYGVGDVAFQPPLWGVNTVVSTAVPAKTVLVGAFKASTTVYRKGGVRVESTNSDQGKFTQNKVTTRIEERVALANRIPAATVKVTVL